VPSFVVQFRLHRLGTEISFVTALAQINMNGRNGMAENIGSRGNALYVLATNLIVVIGVVAFIYVGEQINHGSRKATVVFAGPLTTSSPISPAGFVEQR
jgi:hypothetical protein